MKLQTTVLCAALVFLASCTMSANVPIGDGGLFSDPSCGAPCFWGMKPGQTTESEARRVLDERAVTNDCHDWRNMSSAWYTMSPPGASGIECEFQGRGPSGSPGVILIAFSPQTDVVNGISFTPAGLVTLKDIMHKYGSPSSVAIWNSGIPEHSTIDTEILFDSFLMAIGLAQQDGRLYDVRPDAQVQNVRYASSADYAAYRQRIAYLTFPWNGYGTYPPK